MVNVTCSEVVFLLSSSPAVGTCNSYRQCFRSKLFWGPVQPRSDTSVPHHVTTEKELPGQLRNESSCNALYMKEIQMLCLHFPHYIVWNEKYSPPWVQSVKHRNQNFSSAMVPWVLFLLGLLLFLMQCQVAIY